MNSILCFSLLLILTANVSYSQKLTPSASLRSGEIPSIYIPFGGNAYTTNKERMGGNITNAGIVNWTNEKVYFSTHVRFQKPQKVQAWLVIKVPEGKSRIGISVNGISKEFEAEGNAEKTYYAGEWTIKDSGYTAFVIKGISKTGSHFGNVTTLKLSGNIIADRTAFVKDNEGNFFHWGRRGPSVHLTYACPENTDIEWFYNEITVPKDNDIVGSYFMANGFAEGYFGIQVNSQSERRILFSVWSPFNTNDPKSIPEDQKIRLIKKGVDVNTGEFGNEGSGGQSYMKYNWKASVTYKFLLHGMPDSTGHTTYTAYFYEPGNERWILIASFRRPKTTTYLKRLHSFLENFSPEHGDIERKVYLSNQWVRNSKGQWTELDSAKFTGDNTAAKGYRLDYGGGVSNNLFYLRNCGFFDNYTKLNTTFKKVSTGKKPEIDVEKM